MAKDIAIVQAQRLSGNVGDVLTKTENGVKWQVPQGGTGTGLPEGGTAGKYLRKTADGVAWMDASWSGAAVSGLPAGGMKGDVLGLDSDSVPAWMSAYVVPEDGAENDVLTMGVDGELHWAPQAAYISVDSELDRSSSNPVKNKAISDALASIDTQLLALFGLLSKARLTVVHATGEAPEGAAWDVDSDSDWRAFGYTDTVDAGTHSVGFKPLLGHVAPDRQSVSLVAGSAVTVSATYDSQPGVTVNAYGDVPSGAFWSIAPAATPADVQSYAYGSTQGVEPGQYVIRPSGYGEYDTAADGFTWDDTLTGYPITVVDGAGLVVDITYTTKTQQSTTPAAYSVQSTGNSITGTFTLEENITTTYNGVQYPVYKNGSTYLAMRSNGRPAFNGSADGASTSGWVKSGYTAGAEMTAESLSGEWANGPDVSEDELTFTEVAG